MVKIGHRGADSAYNYFIRWVTFISKRILWFQNGLGIQKVFYQRRWRQSLWWVSVKCVDGQLFRTFSHSLRCAECSAGENSFIHIKKKGSYFSLPLCYSSNIKPFQHGHPRSYALKLMNHLFCEFLVFVLSTCVLMYVSVRVCVSVSAYFV